MFPIELGVSKVMKVQKYLAIFLENKLGNFEDLFVVFNKLF